MKRYLTVGIRQIIQRGKLLKLFIANAFPTAINSLQTIKFSLRVSLW